MSSREKICHLRIATISLTRFLINLRNVNHFRVEAIASSESSMSHSLASDLLGFALEFISHMFCSWLKCKRTRLMRWLTKLGFIYSISVTVAKVNFLLDRNLFQLLASPGDKIHQNKTK